MNQRRQFLNDQDRSKIRADIYGSTRYRSEKDGKIQFFSRYCEQKDILDLGCVDHNPENERSALWLHGTIKKVAASVVGLDYYDAGVKHLQALGYDVISADAQNFNFDRKFDVVTAGDLIEHVENPGSMFSCVNNHLEVGGTFVISTPNPWCWKYTLYFWFLGRMDKINQEHVAWYCPETLKLLGKRYGFEVLEIQYSARRFWEKIIPLPFTLRCTTINVAFVKKS